MSKDQATFILHNLLQEFYYLNDRILFGDLSQTAVLKKAKHVLAEEQVYLAAIPGCTDAWLDAYIAGGLVAVSYRITWADGEIIKGNAMPVRK